MRILAIDTALDACSATVYDAAEDRTLAITSHDMRRGHAEALIPLIAEVMKSAGLGYEDLDRIATTTGPGSYTGLRVGISAAKGIGFAADRPVIGITTLAALTAPLIEENEAVPVVGAIDARHGNVYFHMMGANYRVLLSPRHSSIQEALQLIATGPVRLVGPGAQLLNVNWPRSSTLPLSIDRRKAPQVEWVAKLAAQADPSRAVARPLYLRAPDATPQEGHRVPRQ